MIHCSSLNFKFQNPNVKVQNLKVLLFEILILFGIDSPSVHHFVRTLDLI